MHATLVWWSLWGLVVGIGLFGLQEAHRNGVHWLMSIPLLTGALAAAALRLKHEYHEAMLHAKWVAISAGLFLLGTGYMYLKTQAYGPFATGTQHRAFLGSTFGMSEAEVERAISRKLTPLGIEAGGLKERVLDMIPNFERQPESRVLTELLVYRVPCKATFDFYGGRLAKVRVEFQPTATAETAALMDRVKDDMAKEYRRADTSTPAGSYLYRKEAVDASVIQTPIDPLHQQIVVHLEYLPLAVKQPAPLAVEAKAF